MIFMIINKEQLEGTDNKQTVQMLFERQKQTLDSFLERNAISKEQYDKSLATLEERMRI